MQDANHKSPSTTIRKSASFSRNPRFADINLPHWFIIWGAYHPSMGSVPHTGSLVSVIALVPRATRELEERRGDLPLCSSITLASIAYPHPGGRLRRHLRRLAMTLKFGVIARSIFPTLAVWARVRRSGLPHRPGVSLSKRTTRTERLDIIGRYRI